VSTSNKLILNIHAPTFSKIVFGVLISGTESRMQVQSDNQATKNHKKVNFSDPAFLLGL